MCRQTNKSQTIIKSKNYNSENNLFLPNINFRKREKIVIDQDFFDTPSLKRFSFFFLNLNLSMEGEKRFLKEKKKNWRLTDFEKKTF